MNAYHYAECGLDNVFLADGFHFVKTAEGESAIVIDDVAGLHRAIREDLIDEPRDLTNREFRFLRRELDVSQRQLATILGVEEQTVSMWERGGSPIQKAAEILLRIWIKEFDTEKPAVRELTERLNALDRELHSDRRQEFSRLGAHWVKKAA